MSESDGMRKDGKEQEDIIKTKYPYFIGTICIYFHANVYFHISTKVDNI